MAIQCKSCGLSFGVEVLDAGSSDCPLCGDRLRVPRSLHAQIEARRVQEEAEVEAERAMLERPFSVMVRSNAAVIRVNTKSTDNVQDLKAKIEQISDIPADRQRLSFNGTDMEVGYTLYKYGIVNSEWIDMTVNPAMIKDVSPPTFPSGEVVPPPPPFSSIAYQPMNLVPQDNDEMVPSLDELKRDYEEKKAAYDKARHDVLQAKLRFDDARAGRMQIHVKAHFGQKLITLNVKSTDNIAKVKLMIHGKEGTSSETQTLCLKFGENLEDGRTLAHYNIVHGSTLWLGVKANFGGGASSSSQGGSGSGSQG